MGGNLERNFLWANELFILYIVLFTACLHGLCCFTYTIRAYTLVLVRSLSVKPFFFDAISGKIVEEERKLRYLTRLYILQKYLYRGGRKELFADKERERKRKRKTGLNLDFSL